MATICYGVCGEGRGHATRAQAVIELLGNREPDRSHEFHVFTYGQALPLLRPLEDHSNVRVHEINGLRFGYNRSGHLSPTRTIGQTLRVLKGYRSNVNSLARCLEQLKPSLVISDFEPLLPRAAAKASVPYLALDHQHFLTHCDFRRLPLRLRAYASALAPAVRLYDCGPRATVVSSFFAQLERDTEQTRHIGVLMRSKVLQLEPECGRHVVAYFRRQAPAGLLRALRQLGVETRIYGLGEQERQGNLRFLPVHPGRFLDDLASARALVSTAGNQLVGEALYLGKPVLAIPEAGNFEQEINGHYVSRMGVGGYLRARSITRSILTRFLDRAELYRSRIERSAVIGNQAAQAIIERQLRPHGTA